MTTAVDSIRTELTSILGELRVSSEAVTRKSLTVDGKVPDYVVYPPSAEQVAEVLKYAAEHDVAVIPCRNATKLDIGNPPRRYDVALSLKDMNRVWHYEPADLTVSVEPGMKLGDFQRFLGRHRLWLPLDPPGGARASLGGILATNSTGLLRIHYGAPRDIVLGMKVATSEGKIVKTGGRVVKNVAGYDLAKLLVGSFGTLGVIVEASLKLYPLPAERVTFVVSASTLDAAREFRRSILNSPLSPMRMVLLGATASALVRNLASPTTAMPGSEGPLAEEREFEIWIEAGGSKRVLGRYGRELEELGRAVGASVRPMETELAEAGWARVSDFYAWLSEAFPNLVVVKAVLPIAEGERFLSRALKEAEEEEIRVASFSQTAAGVIYLGLMEAARAPIQVGLLKRIRDAAESLGGALIIERCPPELKSRLDVWGAVGDDFEIMRKVKAAWDPKGILAPGRYPGGL